MKKLFIFLAFILVSVTLLQAQTTHQVAVTNNVFTPADLTIQVGDIVEWNCTQGSHNVNGTTATFPSNPASFGNSVAPATWTYSYTFNTTGTYDYQCDPHQFIGMVGTITVAPAAPDNDDCTNATLLTVGSSCSMQSFNSQDQTAENPQPAPNPSCGFFQGKDVWFKAVVPTSGALRVEKSNGTLNAQFAIYSGTCGSMEQVTCAQLDNARTIHRPDLAGQTVYIRVWGYNTANGGTFDLCVWEPTIPANNYCADAIQLTVGQTCVPQTFTCVYATADTTPNTPNPGCGFYQGGDVWFTFDVPASGEIRIDRNNITGNAQYAVYDGTCGNFTVLDCAQLDDGTTLILPDQAGQTVYLRVWGYNTEEGAEFNICVWEPTIPANNYCADAIQLTVGQTCVPQTFTCVYATADTTPNTPNPGCGFYQGGDVWFTFDVPASGEIRIDRTNITGNAQYAVYDGTCGNFTVLDCAQLDDGTTLILPDQAGQTVYLRVWGYNTEEGAEFDICVWDPPIPANDLCANAIALPVSDTCDFSAYSGLYATTDTAGTAPNPGCGFYQGGDVWFTVEMPATGMLHLERQNTSGNAQFALYEGTCGNFTSVIDCAQLTSQMEINEPSLAGETLYLRVFGYNSEEGAEFEFCAFDTTCVSFDVSIIQIGNQLAAVPNDADITYWWDSCPVGPIGSLGQTYIPPSSGDWMVTASSNSGCVATSECFNYMVTDVDQLTDASVRIYPNPSDGFVRIAVPSTFKQGLLEVFRTDGTLTESFTVTDVSEPLELNLGSGVYIVRWSSDQGQTSIQRLVILND